MKQIMPERNATRTLVTRQQEVSLLFWTKNTRGLLSKERFYAEMHMPVPALNSTKKLVKQFPIGEKSVFLRNLFPRRLFLVL